MVVSDAVGDLYHRSERFHNLKYDTPECAESSTSNPPSNTIVRCPARM
jgi:hypothetical protein